MVYLLAILIGVVVIFALAVLLGTFKHYVIRPRWGQRGIYTFDAITDIIIAAAFFAAPRTSGNIFLGFVFVLVAVFNSYLATAVKDDGKP